MFLDAGKLLLGGAGLYFGAEWLVSGAAGLAAMFGLRPLVIGLTVVAYGTSAPEMTVGVAAAWDGRGAIAIANSVGSNIANLGLILGLTTLISPPRVDSGLIRLELPFLFGSALLLPLALLDGRISRPEGVAMVLAAVGYTIWMIRRSPAVPLEVPRAVEADAETAGQAPKVRGKERMALVAFIGLLLLVGGGRLFVDGAVGLARWAGISDHVIGLTVVAVGTSLPELAASLVAALRGHSSIAVGNIVGSNIFNIIVILGAAALVRPVAGDLRAMTLDLGFMLGLTLFACVAMRAARVVHRAEGALLLVSYAAFLVALSVR